MSQLQLRDDDETSLHEGDLPSQGGGGYVPTIMPGISHFRLPANIDQCWDAKDYPKKDAHGNTLTDAQNNPLVEQHLLLQFNKDNPMVVVGGPYDGLPATMTVTTIGRKRGKKSDVDAPVVADLTYLVRDSLQDRTPVAKRKEWIPIVNKHAGAVVRLEHGLSAQCDPERVIYLEDGAGGVVEDPNGTKGCGNPAGKANLNAGQTTRLYTNDFKVKRFMVQTTGEVYNTREEAVEVCQALGVAATDIKPVEVFTERVVCKGCGATLRGFFRVERFLKPLGSAQQA